MSKHYRPEPMDVSDVRLPESLMPLIDRIARNTHEIWAYNRQQESPPWVYGQKRDDILKRTPCMVPYEELPDSEKLYDIELSVNVLKLIIKLGYNITKAEEL